MENKTVFNATWPIMNKPVDHLPSRRMVAGFLKTFLIRLRQCFNPMHQEMHLVNSLINMPVAAKPGCVEYAKKKGVECCVLKQEFSE